MTHPSVADVPLSKRLASAFFIPVALLAVLGGLLGWQVWQMRSDSRALDHSDAVIGKAYELQKRCVDQETAIRGFIITGVSEFLQPFERANPEETIADLSRLVMNDPVQSGRLQKVRDRHERWLDAAREAVAQRQHALELGNMHERKTRMDLLRETTAEFINAEQATRQALLLESEASTRNTAAAFVALFAIAALAIASVSRRQLTSIARTYNTALAGEQAVRRDLEGQAFIRSNLLELSESVQGNLSVEELAARALSFIATKTGARVAALYVLDNDVLRRAASHGVDARAVPQLFVLGEGLVGQAAVDKKRRQLTQVDAEQLRVKSALLDAAPISLELLPFVSDGAVQGVIELGYLESLDERQLELLERAADLIAVGLRSADYRARLQALLARTQEQATMLQSQQEELRVQNEELEEQSQALQATQRELENQQTELEQVNHSLERQAVMLEEKNQDLTRAQQAISEKAAEAARANRYKSEFLANMSHELRTPLNSALILAKVLADNKERNLTDEQVRFARTIYGAGNDLLALINDVLDLSKIEAGRIDIQRAPIQITQIVEQVKRTFEPIARERSLTLAINVSEAPSSFESDSQKVQQILTNLLSNAFKFTERGGVTLSVTREGNDRVRFRVQDTGIGIPHDKLEVVFEAFRQADGTTARRYGGTGLGLSIARDLARALGGDIVVESEAGRGSAFSLVLPLELRLPASEPGARVSSSPGRALPAPSAAPPSHEPPPRLTRPTPAPTPVTDDRGALDPSRRLILLVEDDTRFAEIVVSFAHELEFQCVVATTGGAGLELANELRPNAIVLDVHLPDGSGLSVLDRLKHDPNLRHIPVHVISVADHTHAALEMGAVGYLQKPTTREGVIGVLKRLEATFTRSVRKVLVIEDDPVQRDSISVLLGSENVTTTAVGSVAEALQALKDNTFDCVVTDLSLPDGSGYDLLETLSRDDSYSFPPVVVYTGRSLSAEEEQRLRRFSDSIIVKGARSPERLLDEVSLFLHQVESELPDDRQRMLRQARDRESVFEGRRILIVEDDVRTIFAMSTLLETKGAKLEIARNGREALDVLERTPDIDLVLMDLMMPEMDGLEATRRIRAQKKWAKLPIIALTAKAMSDDREKCMEAGANDYTSKPVNVEMLLSLLRVWMPR